jgi:hypothetical protein
MRRVHSISFFPVENSICKVEHFCDSLRFMTCSRVLRDAARSSIWDKRHEYGKHTDEWNAGILAVWGDVTRLREKNVANMAHKKKTLETTGLFRRELVCQLAQKPEVGSRKSEIRGQIEKCKVQNAKCKLEKEVEAGSCVRGKMRGSVVVSKMRKEGSYGYLVFRLWQQSLD